VVSLAIPLNNFHTTTGRILVVLVGAAVLLVTLAGVWRLFARAFFYGFLVATGVFLSFDIVVFHWLFGLHRITEGPEAGPIEVVMVALGIALVTLGLIGDHRDRRRSPSATS